MAVIAVNLLDVVRFQVHGWSWIGFGFTAIGESRPVRPMLTPPNRQIHRLANAVRIQFRPTLISTRTISASCLAARSRPLSSPGRFDGSCQAVTPMGLALVCSADSPSTKSTAVHLKWRDLSRGLDMTANVVAHAQRGRGAIFGSLTFSRHQSATHILLSSC